MGALVQALRPGRVAAPRTDVVRTGLFTVPADHRVAFHLTLDDRPGAPAARVRLTLVDVSGRTVAERAATLGAGQSLTLRLEQAGLFRAYAEVAHPAVNLSARRTAIGGVEVIDSLGTTIRPICSFDKTGVGAGRD